MKKHFLLGVFALLLTTFNVNAQKIGELVSGMPTITVDKAELINTFNHRLLEASGIDGKFDAVTVMANGKSNGSINYFLLFSGPTCKSTLSVSLSTTINTDGTIGETALIANGKVACTTTDCAESNTGCQPKLWGGCTACPDKGVCTRTTTSYSLLKM